MKVFVTGATGVLGRRVLPMLRDEGHQVTALARGKAETVRKQGAMPIEADLFEADAVASAVDGHDAVLDLATRIPSTNRMMLPWAWRQNDRLRSIASRHVARAAIETGARYIRESIALLYRDGQDAWIAEDHPLEPIANLRSALDAEDAAALVTSAGGTGIALRFALFYGPDSPHTTDQLASARKGIAPVIGSADGFISQVHLDDAATAVVASLTAPPGIYNVVEDEPVRRGELIAAFEEIAGRNLKSLPRFLAGFGPAKAVARSLRIENAKLREATGWAPEWQSSTTGLRSIARTK